VWIGRTPPRRIKDLAARETREEAQRLLYVALTRARAQLVLPVFTTTSGCDGRGSFDAATADPKGDYGVLNPRLRAFLDGPEDGLFETVPLRRADRETPPAPPPAAPVRIPDPPGDRERLARGARVPRVESFTSLSREFRASDRWDPEASAMDEGGPLPPEDGARALPGGTAVGTGLHALLEAAPLASVLDALDPEAWTARPDVSTALERAMVLAGLEPFHREAFATLAFRALRTPLRIPGGPAVGGLGTLLREMPFLIRRPGSPDRLEGSIDVLFPWEGRTFFLDWKTNQLPDYGPGACGRTLASHYALQFAIYTLAVCRFLEIEDGPDYEARFGGGCYVFLRGLPRGGQVALRPAWSEVQAWARALEEGREEAIHVDL
jgi:exodeoxyribonuclease V beta subunit